MITYVLLGTCLALVVLLSVNMLTAGAVSILWKLMRRSAQRRSAAFRARLSLALRMAPSTIAVVMVIVFVIPAYLIHEPLYSGEVVSFKLATLAAISVLGVMLAVMRSMASWLTTRRLEADWLRYAKPLELPDRSAPAYSIEHSFPVIAIVGIFRPRLFIAAQVLDSLSAEELSAAIAHEARHLRARDNLKRLLLRFCGDALMVLPGGRSLEREWSEAVELWADEQAAGQSRKTAIDLASALVKIAQLAPVGTQPAMPAGAFLMSPNEGVLAWRVRQLVARAESGLESGARKSRLTQTAVKGGLAVFCAVPIYAAAYTRLLAVVHTVIERVVIALS